MGHVGTGIGALARGRDPGTEVTLYWLGSSLAVVVAMGNLFSGMKWSWFGPGDEAPSGLLAGGMLVVMSALALVRWRGAEITGTEVTLYWLGSSLAVVVAMSALFSGMEWSWFGPGYEAPSGLLAGGMLAAIIRVILRRLLRQRAAA